MRKLLTLITLILLLAGCNNEENTTEIEISPPLLTNIYFMIEEQIGDAWQNFVQISIDTEGIITDLTLNSITPLSSSTRREIAQLEGFDIAFGYNFFEQALGVEKNLIGIHRSQLINEMRYQLETSELDFELSPFIILAAQALNNRIVERGPFIDGVYQFKDIPQNSEFEYFINLYIIHGYIVSAHFSILESDVFSPPEISQNPNWRRQANLLEKELIATQDPTSFLFDTDGFATDFPNVFIEIEFFVNLVTQALANGPLTH